QLFIRNLKGRTITIILNEATTVDVALEEVLRKEGLELVRSKLFLLFEGKVLQRGQALSHYGIRQDSTLHLAARQVGG
ncbi:ubiquitin P37aP38A, partial [Ascobolus immersus RN42]